MSNFLANPHNPNLNLNAVKKTTKAFLQAENAYLEQQLMFKKDEYNSLECSLTNRLKKLLKTIEEKDDMMNSGFRELWLQWTDGGAMFYNRGWKDTMREMKSSYCSKALLYINDRMCEEYGIKEEDFCDSDEEEEEPGQL
jgi:hypothetical protein